MQKSPDTIENTQLTEQMAEEQRQLCRVLSSGLLMDVDIYLVRKKIKKTQIVEDVCIMKNSGSQINQ